MRVRPKVWPAVLFLAAAWTLGPVPAAAQGDDAVVVRRGDEPRTWRESPGGASFAELYGDPATAGPFAFLMKMPPDWTMRSHRHDVGEYLTVMRGTLRMTFEPDGEWIDLPPGSVVAIPAGVPMWARTGTEETVIQVHGVGPFHTEPIE